MANNGRTEKKVNAIVEEILDEDRDEDLGATRSGSCPEDCDQPDDTPKDLSQRCKCGVENSLRFSLRVMEAMRALQRDAVDQLATSTAEDIVEHIRTNYRNDGDLYAQVRTVLRQVCSQGFVVELFDNEYHLIGPIVSSTSRCSADCDARATDDIARGRRSTDDRSACRCGRFSGRNGPTREETYVDDLSEDLATDAILHSTAISHDTEADNADYSDKRLDRTELPFHCDCGDTQDDHRQGHDIGEVRKTERRDESAIAGPSGVIARAPSPIPTRREARPEDLRMRVANENDEEATTDVEVEVTARPRSRPRRRRRRVVARNRRRKRRREDTEEVAEDDTDEDTEDSAYRELRRRIPRARSKARERELKRWIRRCRRECERRRTR